MLFYVFLDDIYDASNRRSRFASNVTLIKSGQERLLNIICVHVRTHIYTFTKPMKLQDISYQLGLVY
jgi:hypothetical protein